MCLFVHRGICIEKKNQLDVTECFIGLMICSACFGHFYAHDLTKLTISDSHRLITLHIKDLYVNIPITETIDIARTDLLKQ